MTALTEWANFYVIVASSAGALIGLPFAVTLVADKQICSAMCRPAGVPGSSVENLTIRAANSMRRSSS